MNLFANIRQRQTPWARRVLGIFVVVWLNLALQPCVMAFGDEEQPHCPNCPPAHTEQHRGHDMDSIEAMADRDMPCADGSADCNILDDFYYDGRSALGKYSLDDSSIDVLPIAEFRFSAKQTRHFRNVRSVQGHPRSPPQNLNKLFCVYVI